MRSKEYSWAWVKIDSFLGEGTSEYLKTLEAKQLRQLAGLLGVKMAEEWGEEEERKTFNVISRGEKTDEKEREKQWDIKSQLQDVVESQEAGYEEKCEAVKRLGVLEAIGLLMHDWAKEEEIAGGLAIMLDMTKNKSIVKDELTKWRDQQSQKNQAQSDKTIWIKEMMPGWKWEEKYTIEETDGCICFYRKGDKYKYMPLAAFFPALSEEEIEKINGLMEGALPKEYGEFLKKANGVNLGGRYYWWGIRKFYNERKHLEQYYSLINGRIDEQLAALMSPTEVVIGSDRFHNIYLMDQVNGAVSGLIRHHGDEMAIPQKESYASLGELMQSQIEEVEKIEEREFKL